MKFKIGFICVVVLSCLYLGEVKATDWKDLLRDEADYWQASSSDTIPLSDRDGDFTTEEYSNPFDIQPTDIQQTIEYDPDSDTYIIYEKLGDEYLTMPSYMTFDEYLDWKSEQSDKEYFSKLSGIGDNDRGKSGLLDPMSKVNIQDKLKDRLFGGSGITIKPQGNIDISIGTRYQFVNNGINPTRAIDRWSMLFEPKIKINVDGNIGDKMDLGFNYDTQATFDSDQKIKLTYDSEQFTEDDIIKKIEAGNISMPLRSSLITGAQSLFGIKTDLQFGHLKLTAVASQQRSKPKNLTVQNGAQIQEFELRPTDYDENRHFFVSHYHRNAYEGALTNLPHVLSAFKITNLEVWISDDRPDYDENSTQIVGLVDLGTADAENFANPNTVKQDVQFGKDRNGDNLPSNKANNLFKVLEGDQDSREFDNINQSLRMEYGMEGTRDFEQFKGRILRPNEYTFNQELGFISLNIRLQPNQQLAVSYEYFYTQNCDEVYRVGELATDAQISSTDSTGVAQPETVLFAKMLKSSNQSISHPTWDLMMKNVYALRTNNLSQKDFRFDIFYEDDRDGGTLKKYLPVFTDNNGVVFDKSRDPLLNVFNLDNLNSVNDPQPDGVFDYVPGITVIPRVGAIIFPTLEPFGNTLNEFIGDDFPGAQEFFAYDSLYRNTVTIAELDLAASKFVMVGEYKSDTSAEISLGSWDIPRGSVTVRAGGKVLIEGVDYEVDYGIGRLRILNEAYLQQGVPLDIQLEDDAFFSLQQKNMLGLRADYAFSENFSIGGTYMKLSERPFTQKVNLGDDPINNRVLGFDMAYQKNSPWVTKVLDKLPLYSTNAESAVSFNAEVAALKPGHRRVINVEADGDNEGAVNIDDFEGAVTGLPLGSSPFSWQLSSVPEDEEWPEATADSTFSGVNRAMLNWYLADINARTGADADNSYSRGVLQNDIFNRDLPINVRQDLFTFDLLYDPTVRGPYNFDVPNGGTDFSAGISTETDLELGLLLEEPETRWGGVMRYLNTNDFQAANYEFIEFWMLNPFMDQVDYDGNVVSPEGMEVNGKLVFHLGSVSEDILKDGVQFYENAVPVDGQQNAVAIKETPFGLVPLTPPVTGAFDVSTKEQQDLGLDGLSSTDERVKHDAWLQEVAIGLGGNVPQVVENDPSNDDFAFFGDATVFEDADNLVTKYRLFSNSEDNSPDIQGSDTQVNQSLANNNVRGKFAPDSEDLNGNNSLDQSENFFKYEVPIVNDGFNEIDVEAARFITDVVIPENRPEEKWYRFQVPIQDASIYETEGDIDGFRSIQFMRLITKGFASRKIFRMAEFELVRSQWRRDTNPCQRPGGDGSLADVEFNLDTRGVEENGSKIPFGYEIPQGVQQELIFNSISANQLNERSLAMNFGDLEGGCEVSMNKLLDMDLRLFKRLQLFVHAEEAIDDMGNLLGVVEDDELELFVRFAKDYEFNYYEYTIPLNMSSIDTLRGDPGYVDNLWREENFLDVGVQDLVDLKLERNALGLDILEEYRQPYREDEGLDHSIAVVGNPTLGLVKGIQIGVRNTRDLGTEVVSGEVWVNELRAVGFEESPSVAALARLDVQLADLGNLSVSGKYSSIGWGALDQRLQERNREELIDYDIATSLELGKFLPSQWNVRIPFYAQYLKSISNPEYHPFDSDVKLRDKVNEGDTQAERDEIRSAAQDVTTIKTINFTNVKKERSTKPKQPTKTAQSTKTAGPTIDPNNKDLTPEELKVLEKAKKKEERKSRPRVPKPWDISNFSASYGYTETDRRDPLLEFDNTIEHRAGLDYVYQRKIKYITPFSKIKSKHLAVIKQFNFNPFPNSFAFNTTLDRTHKQRKFRQPDIPVFQFDEKNFSWTRQYDLKWDLTKALNIRFNATNQSFVDELRQVGIADLADDRQWEDENGIDRTIDVDDNADFVQDYWRDNLRAGGRNRTYDHAIQASYTLPIRYLPLLDWITIKAQYKADYNWTAGQLIQIDGNGNQPGGVIKNSQNRSVNGTFDFKKLYSKSKYIKELDKTGSSSTEKKSRSSSSRDQLSKDTAPADVVGPDGKKPKAERTKDSDGPRTPGIAEKILLRPLFSLRTIKATYREDLSTLVPGFGGNAGDPSAVNPQFFGLSEGFNAPGWAFVSGIQPDITKTDANDNWLYQNITNWNRSEVLNKQIYQDKRQTVELDIALEPWKDFDIDVEFFKKTSLNHSEEFTFLNKNGEAGFVQQALYDVGSVEFSFFTLNTLFGDGTQDERAITLFNTLRDNRSVVSQRLARSTDTHTIDGEEYSFGNGKLNNDVVVPSFIAAYTGQSAADVNLDIIEQTSAWDFLPSPNWKVNYGGLAKLPMFNKYFKSINLKHAYKNTFGILRFNSDPTFDTLDDPDEVKQASQNYYTRWELPSVQINESFSPLIGLELQTQNNIRLQAEYKKARILELFTTVGELKEQLNTDFVFGAGFEFEDVNISFLTGKKKNSKKRQRPTTNETDEEDVPLRDNRRSKRSGGLSSIIDTGEETPRSLIFDLSFTISDNVTFAHDLRNDELIPQAVRGTRQFRINPSIEYDISKNFSIRWYAEYGRTTPKVTPPFPVTNFETAFVLRFKLN